MDLVVAALIGYLAAQIGGADRQASAQGDSGAGSSSSVPGSGGLPAAVARGVRPAVWRGADRTGGATGSLVSHLSVQPVSRIAWGGIAGRGGRGAQRPSALPRSSDRRKTLFPPAYPMVLVATSGLGGANVTHSRSAPVTSATLRRTRFRVDEKIASSPVPCQLSYR